MRDIPRRVLVVDDDRMMVRTLCDILQRAGWETVGAYSGEEATGHVAQSSFTVVLMDVRMGGITGVDALRAMRERRPTLPVVLMTAYASAILLEQATAWGAARVLNKPVPINELLQLLAGIGDTRRALLVVDDDPEFLRSLAAVLADHGYLVHQARSLDGALTRLRECEPAAVLLDLKLDGFEPRQVVDAVQQASGGAAIILCTGFPMLLEGSESGARSGRIVGRLIKPFEPDQLTELLDAAIG